MGGRWRGWWCNGMGGGGVFSAEMPDEPSSAIPPLDADTAERLLGGRLDPDDAPPGYAEVARLLGRPPPRPTRPSRPARQPPCTRTAPPCPGAAPTPRGRRPVGGAGVGRGGGGRRGGGVDSRWSPISRELRSPSGGPSAGRPGSGTPGAGANGAGADGAGLNRAGLNRAGPAGSLRPSQPGLDSAPGPAPAAGRRCLRPANGRRRGTAAV
jgi:hypothetical protein